MSNVIPMPTLDVEMQLSEISGIVDCMLYMHESAEGTDLERVVKAETTLLYVIKDKADTAQKALSRLARRVA